MRAIVSPTRTRNRLKALVVGALVLRQGPRLDIPVGDLYAGMILLNPGSHRWVDISVSRQRWPAPPDFAVMNPVGRRIEDADDEALLGDADLGFDGGSCRNASTAVCGGASGIAAPCSR